MEFYVQSILGLFDVVAKAFLHIKSSGLHFEPSQNPTVYIHNDGRCFEGKYTWSSWFYKMFFWLTKDHDFFLTKN